MASVNPGHLFENYQLLAAAEAAPVPGIFIPLASMSDLTAEEADAAAGDGRKVVFALIREVFDRHVALPDNAKPAKLTIAKTTPAGINSSTVRQTYSLSFDLDISGSVLSSEV